MTDFDRSAPLSATVHLAFAFDIGDEIDLDHSRDLLKGELTRLPRRKRTPESLAYRPSPIRVPVDPIGIKLPGSCELSRPPRAELTLFDFAAVSLSIRFPISTTAAELLVLAGELADTAPLADAARKLLIPWLERLKPAVHDFDVSAIGEEYIIFQLDQQRPDWLEAHSAWIAGLVRWRRAL